MSAMSIIEQSKVNELKEIFKHNCPEGSDEGAFLVTFDTLRLLTEAHITTNENDICLYSKSKNTIRIFKIYKEL